MTFVPGKVPGWASGLVHVETRVGPAAATAAPAIRIASVVRAALIVGLPSRALVLPSGVMDSRPRMLALLAAVHCAALVLAPGAGAQDVELAPFAGIQFPGYLYSAVDGRSHSMGTGLDYGGTLDIPVAEGWRAELLYSRQETDLGRPAGGGGFGLKLERYMVGIEEEKGGDDPLRFFGVLLAGVTRFAPGLAGYDADVRFTLGLS